MNYIVFDLEWNQSYNKDYENPRMPFEIIEIGAVKLDKNFNIIDSYSGLVKPKLYKKLQQHIRSILNYDEEKLKSEGKPFDMIFREFIKWCGEDEYIFCTWGNMDLSYLQNNMDYYYLKPLPIPLKYYDVQQMYSDICDNSGSISKLEKAISKLDIPFEEDKPFHSAVNDAYYTAKVLKAIKPKDFQDRYVYDYYNNPASKEDEIFAYHKKYMEHISTGYDTKQEALLDKDIISTKCYKCSRKTSKKIKWFASSTNTYLCVCKCWYHGYESGKIKFKQNKKGQIFVVKTMHPISKKEVEDIKARQNELRLKRQEKRHNKNSQAEEI